MGEGRNQGLRVAFDGKLRLEFHGANITSDAGLLIYRELDDALGLTEIAESCLRDGRNGKNTVMVLITIVTIGVQPARWIRGHQRRGTALC